MSNRAALLSRGVFLTLQEIWLFRVSGCNITMHKQSEQKQEPTLLKNRRVYTQSDQDIIPKTLSRFRIQSKARLNTIQNDNQPLTRQLSLKHVPTVQAPLSPRSPQKFYESKLNLSSEAWSVYSVRQQKYKRGWRPTQLAEFSGLLRLVTLRIYLEIRKEHPWVEHVMAHVNRFLINRQQKKMDMSQKQLAKIRPRQKLVSFALVENIRILLRDMLLGSVITNYIDLFEYSMVFLGAIIRHIDNGTRMDEKQFLRAQDHHQGNSWLREFVCHANKHLVSHGCKQAHLSESLQFEMTPHDLCCYFSSLIQEEPYTLTLLETQKIVTTLRYPMGYKFYEDRVKKFINEKPLSEERTIISFRGLSNFGVVSYNKSAQYIIVLSDCKFGMAEVDLDRIEAWLINASKPIVHKGPKPTQEGKEELQSVREPVRLKERTVSKSKVSKTVRVNTEQKVVKLFTVKTKKLVTEESKPRLLPLIRQLQ